MKKEKTDARQISPKELERRRRKAIKLREKGMKNSEVADVVGLAPQTISSLYSKFIKCGEGVFKPKKRGRSKYEGRKITQNEEDRIINYLLQSTPLDLGCESILWTRESVQSLISQEIGTRIPITTVGDYLKRWGIGNKPNIVERVLHEDRNTPENFLKRFQYQKIDRRKQKNEIILWIDIISISKQNIKMLHTQTETKKSMFLLYEKTRKNNEILIDFMRKIINSSKNKVYIILIGNYRIEKKTKEWAEKNKNKVEFFVPLYEDMQIRS